MNSARKECVGGITVADLIARCLRGDDQAKALLFSEYAPLAHRAIARKLAYLGMLQNRKSAISATTFSNACWPTIAKC